MLLIQGDVNVGAGPCTIVSVSPVDPTNVGFGLIRST